MITTITMCAYEVCKKWMIILHSLRYAYTGVGTFFRLREPVAEAVKQLIIVPACSVEISFFKIGKHSSNI